MKSLPILSIISVAVVFATIVADEAYGRFAKQDLEKVPIQRLITNLTAKAAKQPSDGDLLHQLGRVHAMAYAYKLVDGHELVEVNQGRKDYPRLWFGNLPLGIPFHEVKSGAKGKNKEAAAAHLKRAIAAYERARKATPDDPLIELGYGWCMEQMGDKIKAIKAYRAAVVGFWDREKAKRMRLGPFATAETVNYLVPLLNKDRDVKEIADLKVKVAKLHALPRALTPIAVGLESRLPLDEMIDLEARVAFDLDGSGRKQRWTWITPKAAWLVYDGAGEGEIDSAIQMFGNRTFMLFLEDGYEALALLDRDGNEALNGEELVNLALWHDRNSDGVSDSGEVRGLREYQIYEIGIRSERRPDGILWAPGGVKRKGRADLDSVDFVLSTLEISVPE